MVSWAVSPKFLNTKLTTGRIEDKIDVFEDQIDGWILNHARGLCSDQYMFRNHSGFAILTLVCPYFEMIESHHVGMESKNRSKEFFRGGLLRVFPNLAATLAAAGYAPAQPLACQIADCLYEQVRCGLLHEATTKNKVLIRRDTAPLGFMLELTSGNIGSIVIDPYLFFNEVDAHFHRYVAKLRDPKEALLRSNFEKFFDFRISRPGAVMAPPVGTPPTNRALPPNAIG